MMLIFLSLLLSFTFSVKTIDPTKQDFCVIQNQGWPSELCNGYNRLPGRAQGKVPGMVWSLSLNSAGLQLHFITNTKKLQVKYVPPEQLTYDQFSSMGKSGLDLYQYDIDGNVQFWGPDGYSINKNAQSAYHWEGLDGGIHEYILYLPSYNQAGSLSIEVDDDASFRFIKQAIERPIVVYGTSIVHGMAPNRPGTGWLNWMGRSLQYPIINLGFWGNAKLESSVMDFVVETNASLFIIDCMANLQHDTEATIKQRVLDAVHKVRQTELTKNTPLIIVEHGGYASGKINQQQYELYAHTNRAQKAAYDELVKEGIQGMTYVTHDDINFTMEDLTDEVHPNDIGMHRMATMMEKVVRNVMNWPIGNISTQIPNRQRRLQNWWERHNNILETVRTQKPKGLLIGDSITHYWGGDPPDEARGKESWDKYLRPLGFVNLGASSDRVENVLYRMYLEELYGYEAEKIGIMIGTNNIKISTDDEILEGQRLLFRQIVQRQPKAKLTVIGIYPRTGFEDRIKKLNQKTEAMCKEEGYLYFDPGASLLKDDGKIEPSYFQSDGLHPNANGYNKLGPLYGEYFK